MAAAGLLDQVPEERRDAVSFALERGVPDAVEQLVGIEGGASALALRASTPNGSYLVRVETAVDYFRDPKRTYPSMLAAAEAGLAPKVHLADAERGVAVMDFIDTYPLADHPGGVDGLLAALG